MKSNTTRPIASFATNGKGSIVFAIGRTDNRERIGLSTNTDIAVAPMAIPYQAISVRRYGRGEGSARNCSAAVRSSLATIR